MAVVTFTVLGEPQGKARARTVRNKATGKTMSFTPARTASYENLVRLEYHAQTGGKFLFPDDKPVYVLIDMFMQAPKTSKKKSGQMLAHLLRPIRKVDWDNCGKIICDSLNGIAYKDDKQVVDGRVRKWWSRQPRVVVTLSDSEINMAKFIVNEEKED